VTVVSKYAARDGHRQDGVDEGPKYKRVASAIEADILSGELAPGMRLLPERELAREFGVSYGTVRHAAEVLRDKGLIQTRHGEGTFVIEPAPDGPNEAD
jgi:GntR family transcriptional regulator